MAAALSLLVLSAIPACAWVAVAPTSPHRHRMRSDPHASRSTQIRAQYAGKLEHTVKDAMMHRAVALQLQTFKSMRHIGQQMWLDSSWVAFLDREKLKGELVRYISYLQQKKTEQQFVPTSQRRFRQGSPNNPYLNKARPGGEGYHCDVEPQKIAEMLMQWRAELSVEWREQLEHLSAHGRANCHDEGCVPDAQLLEGMAMGIALRDILHDTGLRPSQKSTHEWLSTFIIEHQSDLASTGSTESLLSDLREQPLLIRSAGDLIDPLQVHDDLLERTKGIEEKMATVLHDIPLEQMDLRANFLNNCLKW
jgi:hypothetical protein